MKIAATNSFGEALSYAADINDSAGPLSGRTKRAAAWIDGAPLQTDAADRLSFPVDGVWQVVVHGAVAGLHLVAAWVAADCAVFVLDYRAAAGCAHPSLPYCLS